jgi:hypothetical protein
MVASSASFSRGAGRMASTCSRETGAGSDPTAASPQRYVAIELISGSVRITMLVPEIPCIAQRNAKVHSAAKPQPNFRLMERGGLRKNGGCKTNPHQDHTAFQRASMSNLDSTLRLF